MNHAVEARRLLRNCRSGALATLSARLNGHPFASAVSFMTDFDASPILLISRLAEHTKNITFDPRVSLMVHEPNADVQAAARLTLVGTCASVGVSTPIHERYLRLFPQAADLISLDFTFHRIAPTAVRYIGGFSKIHWLSTDTFCAAGRIDAAVEHEWLQRLNGEYAQRLTTQGQAVALDCDGVDFIRAGVAHRIAFTESVEQPQALAMQIHRLLACTST
jgi:hypothetical protein